MSEFRLHCVAQSGNAYKPALMLNLCGADWEPVFVDYFGGETRTTAFRERNVMGEVPVLEHGDLRLSQSGVILDYLADHFGRFGPESAGERREILRWLLFDNHKLTSYTATHRYMHAFVEDAEPAVMAFLKQRAETALGVLASHLGGRRFVLGERPTIADFSMCGYLYFDDELGIDLDAFVAVRHWLGELKSLDGWAHPYDLMPGHPRA